jgi:ABC-type transporter Mla subunit MlaD
MSPARRPRSRRLRFRGALLRGVAVLERRTLMVGIAVAAVGAVIAVFAWMSTNGLPFQGRYPFTMILPGTTPPLATGAQVRVAGKIAGSVTSVEPGPTTLRVNASLFSQYGPLGRSASIHVGVLLGTTLVYLVVNPGSSSHPLPPGTTIPESRVTLSSSLPQALETFNAATRRALARNITVIGEGWIGRGEQTNQAIADQRYDYEQGTPLLHAFLTQHPATLGRLINTAATVSGALRGQRPDDVGAGTAAAATFWQTLAQNDRAGTAVARFAPAEQQLLQTAPLADRAITAATSAARAFNPLAVQVNEEVPSFESLFASGPSLLDASLRFNRYAPAVLRGLVPVLDALRDPAESLPILIADGAIFGRAIDAYKTELGVFATRLAEVTSYTYGGKPAIRITGTLGGCGGSRDPYPAPGQAAKDRKAVIPC